MVRGKCVRVVNSRCCRLASGRFGVPCGRRESDAVTRRWPQPQNLLALKFVPALMLSKSVCKMASASGVVLSTGEEISAKAVISNADPKRTLLKLTDPIHLSPDFVQKLQHYRGNGTVAKVNLALSAVPQFTALRNGDFRAFKAASTSATRSITWNARSTNPNTVSSPTSRTWKSRFHR